MLAAALLAWLQNDPAQPHPQALLVGCSEYPHLLQVFGEERYAREVRLAGPPRDVELVRTTLERVLGLEASDTTVLVGFGEDAATRPTRANILAALARLARDARPGSLAIVYLAGHGSQQVVQRPKADEPDGLDEVFLPADVGRARDGWIPNAIRDDELGACLRAIRDAGADVWLIVDACHSGTMLRAPKADRDVRLRWLDPDELGVASRAAALPDGARLARAQSGWIGRSEPRIAAAYGSQSYGRAPEMPIPRGGEEVHGLFTYLLCQELERTRARVSYQELSERVVAAYQAFPCSLTIPAAEGDLLREVASGAVREGAPLVCFVRGGEPWLNQGRFAGLEPGMQVRVSQNVGGEERPQARLEVVASDALEARCELLEGELSGPGPFAVEIETRPGHDWSLALALVRPDGTRLEREELPEQLRANLEAEADRYPIHEPAAADWWLVVAETGRAWLRPGPREGGYDLWDVSPDELGRRLRSLQTTRNLRRTAADYLASGPDQELDVWIERRDARGRATRLDSGAEVHPGDEIRIRLEKKSARIFDVNIFYLDANLLRQKLCAQRLEAEANATLSLTDWLTVTDDALGQEQLLVLATPREPADPRIDLSWLADDSTLRGAERSPLGALLQGLQRGQDLRGEAGGASAELDATQSLLVGLHSCWRPLRLPDWPAGEPFELRVAPLPPDAGAPPDPYAAGTRAALVRAAGAGPPDTLYLGAEHVAAVFLDLDGRNGLGNEADPLAGLAERLFDAEAVFLWAPDGRYAFYDSQGADRLDRVAVDRDGDGTAEELWLFEDGGWRTWTAMAVPWLSQQHLRWAGGSRKERSLRLGLLQGPD